MIQACQGLGDADGVTEARRELVSLRDSDPTKVFLNARLSAILKGEQQPGDNAERLQLAQRAYEKSLHASAAKLWAEALDTDPKVAEDRQAQHRYNAACASALAGRGQGKTLDHWREDADLAGIREPAVREKLPESEREGFRALWTEVEALRKKASDK